MTEQQERGFWLGVAFLVLVVAGIAIIDWRQRR
jgi:uncharacterized membrane protein YdbT with pleckstrin-like domain